MLNMHKTLQRGAAMQLNEISIWQPLYSEDTVMIDPKKVTEHNKIIFTKAKHLKGKEFYIRGQVIKQYPLRSNGRIMCHNVPMSELELIATPEGKI